MGDNLLRGDVSTSNPDRYADAKREPDAITKSDRHVYAYCYADSNTCGHADADSNSHSHSATSITNTAGHSDTGFVADSGPVWVRFARCLIWG